MTEPTDAEIEAAARAIANTRGRDPDDLAGGPHPGGEWLDEGTPWWRGDIEAARAALTAAAQVRERAGPTLEIRDNEGKNPLITVRPDDVFAWLRDLADAAGYRDRETCAVQINTKQNFVAGQNFHWEVPMLTLMVSNIPNSRRQPTEPDVLGI